MTTSAPRAGTKAERHAIIQFLQHAHRRAEGHLEDFEAALERGMIDEDPCERAAAELRLHLYTEEEILFPCASGSLAGAIAGLKDQHGRLSDLLGEFQALVRERAAIPRIRQALFALNNLLAAHSATEDLGVYPDLVSALGTGKARALLREVDRADLPSGWICSARRRPSGESQAVSN